jgi:hypothetical protein
MFGQLFVSLTQYCNVGELKLVIRQTAIMRHSKTEQYGKNWQDSQKMKVLLISIVYLQYERKKD